MFFGSDKVYFVAMSVIIEEITDLDKITEIALVRLRVAYMAVNCMDGANWIRLGNESIFQ